MTIDDSSGLQHDNDCCDRTKFSTNQWEKGNVVSRCTMCADGGVVMHILWVLLPHIWIKKQLRQHMKTHRPKAVACVVCHGRHFASAPTLYRMWSQATARARARKCAPENLRHHIANRAPTPRRRAEDRIRRLAAVAQCVREALRMQMQHVLAQVRPDVKSAKPPGRF